MTPASAAARLLGTAAAAALLAGCGDKEKSPSPSADNPRTVVETVTQSSTTTVSKEIAVKQVRELTGFSSPSANIGCYIDRRFVRCDIRRRAWKPPPKPASCDLDYGQGIAIGAGERARIVCAGDTALGSKDRLEYGEGIQAGVLRCVSRRVGITCQDTESGHGFSISRERYELL